MRQGTLVILTFICAVSVGAAAFVVSRDYVDPRFAQVSQPVFPGLIDGVNDVRELVVEGAKGRVDI